MAIMGLVVALRAEENINSGSLIGLQRQVELNLFTAVAATVRALGAVLVLAFVSPTISAFFLWQGLVSGASVFILAMMVHRALPAATRSARLSIEPLRGIWRFAAGTLLLTGLGFLLSQSDKLILSSVLSLGAFALYSIAYAVANVVRLLVVPIDLAVFPRLTQFHQSGDTEALSRLYHKAAQSSTVVIGGVGLFLILFGREALALWMMDDALASDTYAVLWILVLGMMLNGLMNTPYSLQLAAGWTGLLVRANAVMVLGFVPATYFLSTRFGATGAAVAWVLVNVVYVVVVVPLMHRRLLVGQLRSWYLSDVALPIAAAGASALLVRMLVPRPETGLAAVLVLGAVLCVSLVTAALTTSTVRGLVTGQLRVVIGKAT
jgi:O-antigen/teichoic acid export membrane protein